MLEVKAYAKVNLSLDIVGRREDGYHLVRMVMQSLDIADILTFEKLDKPEIIVLLDNPSVGGDGDSPLGKVPLDENNLIYKAARLLFDRYIWKRNEKAGVQITLTKNIPIAAGMAGGSSDAAATFRGINELFELGLMDKELMEMGVTLGADIPYCIMGGTALSEGIGEELTRLPDIPECVFLVVKPRISVSTAEAYGGYDSLVESKTGQKVRIIHPDVDGQVDALYAGNLKGVTDKFLNVLEYVTAEKHPIIGDIEKIMLDFGALNAMMSGSGPTVFGIFDDVEKAEAAKKVAKLEGDEKTGAQIVLKALEAPLYTIAENAGVEGSVVVNKVRESKAGMGYNALDDKYVNMVSAGILDPTKVARSALQNATSVASTFLTTEAAVATIKEPAPAAPVAPQGMY